MANFKAQQLDVQDSSARVSINVLPEVGHILPFAGPSNKIPAGWVLCDGSNGTPDLRGKLPGGISNVSVGSNQTHSHTFSHSLGAFNSGSVSDSTTINSRNLSNNNSSHSHSGSASIYAVAWGDSGIANRATGTQANVISRTHTHGGTISGSTTFNSGNQNSNSAHGNISTAVNGNVSTSHSHTASSSPTINSQSLTHTSLPSIFYVNFIMKV